MSEQSEAVEAPAAQPVQSAARWEDYVDVFIAPAELFRRRANDRLTHPVFTLVLASMALYFLMLPANRALFAQRVADNAESAAFFEQWGLLFQIFGGLLVPINILLGVAFAALLLKAACSALNVAIALSQTFLIATYAAFVYLLYQAVAGVFVLIGGGDVDAVRDLSFGVLRFAGDDVPVAARPWLGRLEMFAIWQAVVWGVGMRVIGGATRGQAALAAGAAWVLFALPGALMSLVAPAAPPTQGA